VKWDIHDHLIKRRQRAMNDAWREALAQGHTLVTDGGTGAELQRRGVPVHPVCWNAAAALEHPRELVDVHVDFIRAGAEIVTTNTFATNRYVLAAAGLADRFTQINSAAVAAARRARAVTGAAVAIAGSMSCLPPAYDTRLYPDTQSARDSYVELAETLAALGVDLLVLEMMQDTEHAALALAAAQSTGLPVWLGVSCRLTEGTDDLVGFDFPDRRFAEVLERLLPFAPDVVQIMHTPVGAVPAALACLRQQWSGCIGVAPELGSFDPVTRTRSAAFGPETFAELADGWIADGVNVVGGCCGAGPAHILALAERARR
jgi:methionine synthase I (cobalamin-dependent)